jgi:predicted RNA-binding Zn-ribbon protein involved in translation (DUF1610 family)
VKFGASGNQNEDEVAMRSVELNFCPQCGATGVVTKEITPNHVLELSCPHCGVKAEILWVDRALVGANATHDPDSDSEAW